MITEIIEKIENMIIERGLTQDGSVEIMIYDDWSVDFMISGNAKYNYHAISWKTFDENFDVEDFVRDAISAL
ncbi:hypothetical protein [Streptococcus phage smHBZ8]|nr:hypothetical protein [Streptococcus phage smHBZ8]